MAVDSISRSMRLESLSDGTAVLLRSPTMDDLGQSLRFFRQLPKIERKYLRFDVTQREVVERLIRESEEGKEQRVLAFVDDEVVAHGALRVSADTWQRHIAELRALVAPSYRRRGVGALLISELFRRAQEHNVEKAVVKLAEPQIEVRKVCERLGFHVDAVLPKQVKDAYGRVHDLIVLSCDLDDVSQSLRAFYSEEDWPDG